MMTSDLEAAPHRRSATTAPVNAADQGVRSARERIVHAHSGCLLALARRLTSNEAVAREATRQAFAQLFAAALPFDSDDAVAHTLRKHAVRYIATACEASSNPSALDALLPTYDETTGHLHPLPSLVTPLGDVLERADTRATIRRWVEMLPGPHRLVLVLVDSEGMSIQDVAEAHGESVPDVKRRLHEARQALTTRFAREFGSREPRH
jgi:RNA polymerase sigma-70 factor (ECF subfamily)